MDYLVSDFILSTPLRHTTPPLLYPTPTVHIKRPTYLTPPEKQKVWLATLILGRDVSLATAATYYRYASLPSPKTLRRYWNFSLPSAQVHPTTISKYNTFLQLVLIGGITLLPVAGPSVNAFLSSVGSSVGTGEVMGAAQALVAATTVWSGLSYLWARDAVTILGEGTVERKKRILRRGKGVLGVSFLVCGVVALVLESKYWE